jgi:hypothetical protein
VSHLYTLLVGGTVITNDGTPDVTALAWAADTLLALGSDDEVRAISRGDSRVVELGGAYVVPLGGGLDAAWPPPAVLAVGGPADLDIVAADPRRSVGARAGGTVGRPPAIAIVRGGRVVSGRLPGTRAGDVHGDHDGHAGDEPGAEPQPGR